MRNELDGLLLGFILEKSSIIVNGVEGRKFICKRSFRQGDPLSPLHFVLVVDVFSRILNKGKETRSYSRAW